MMNKLKAAQLKDLLSEESNTNSLISHKDLVEAAKLKYPQTKNYKDCIVFNSHYCEQIVLDKIKVDGTKIIRDYDKKQEYSNMSYFIYEKNGLFIVYDYYFTLEQSSVILVFYNDIKDVDALFKDDIVYYTSGNYMLEETSGGYILKKIKLSEERIPILNDNVEEQIMKDLDMFFKNKDFYYKNKITYKRGILLYGPPGTGKSSIIKEVFKNMKDSMNIIIDCTKNFDKDVMTYLDIVAKNSKKILVFEDIDEVRDYDRSSFLNFLDGIEGLNNTFIIATTNNICKVDRALVNRPSRFDRTYYFGLPNEESRVKLIERFFGKDVDIKELVKLTEGFTGAYFKELFIFKHIQNCSVEEAAKNLRKQIELFKMKPEETYIG